jgi:hypothetical protein
MVGFEHMPRRGEVVPEVAEEFAVGDGDEEFPRGDTVDLAEDRGGVVEVFEDFEAEGGVEGGVGEREGAAVDVVVREAEAGEFGAIGGVDFGAHPIVAVGEEAAAVRAEAAADVEDAEGARRRLGNRPTGGGGDGRERWAQVTAEEQSDFAAALGLGGAFGEDVGAALDRSGALVEEDAEVVGAVVARDRWDGDGGERGGEGAVVEAGVEVEGQRGRGRNGERGRGRERVGGVVAEEFEAGEGGGREGEGGGDVGAGVERPGESEAGVGAVRCGGVGFEGSDLRLGGVEPEPAAELDVQRVDGGGRGGGVEVGGHGAVDFFDRGLRRWRGWFCVIEALSAKSA